LIERRVTVISAWQANAIPVAEFTVAQILLSNKGYFQNTRNVHSLREWQKSFRGRGNYGETIALLGAGAIGSKVIALLQPFQLHVIVYDPFLSNSQADELGVEKVSLEAAFHRAYVVSNHLANLPQTERMLRGDLFATMRENATFINTGRGATVDEEGMLRVLSSRRDLTALLDVTWPEPPSENALFYSLPNVQLTTHIAGSLNDEVIRMADYCIEEFESWVNGQPLRYEVSAQMLATMA
jgi:phosphoglycerate dehydrogenase-like enzyme